MPSWLCRCITQTLGWAVSLSHVHKGAVFVWLGQRLADRKRDSGVGLNFGLWRGRERLKGTEWATENLGISIVKTRSRKNRILKSLGKRLWGVGTRERKPSLLSGRVTPWESPAENWPQGPNSPQGQKEKKKKKNKQAERVLLRLEVLPCLKGWPRKTEEGGTLAGIGSVL